MGLNRWLSCKYSGLIETVVSITATIRVFTSLKALIINIELFILFLSKKFKTDWTWVFKFKLDQGWIRKPYVHLQYPLVIVIIFSPTASDFLMITLKNKAEMVMSVIYHSTPFYRMHFFMSVFKESFKHSDALLLFWSARVF